MLFVFDWDGTLGGHESKLSDKNREALKLIKEKGHEVIVATGRGPMDLIEKMGEDHKLLSRYIIGGNGSLIYDFIEEKFVQEIKLPNRIVLKVANLCKNYQKRFGLVYRDKTVYFKHDDVKYNYSTKDVFSNSRHVFNEQILGKKDSVNIMGIEFDSFHEMKNNFNFISENLNSEDVNVIFADMVYVQVVPKGVNKFLSIQKAKKLLQIENEQVISFGDSENDIEMLKNSNISISMGHSEERIKNISNHVIESSEKIYEFVMKLLK